MAALRLFFRYGWIGVCALSMLAQTRLLLGLSLVPGYLDGFVLGGAVFAYGFTHTNRRVKAGAWLAGLFGGLCFLFPLVARPSPGSWHWAVCVPAALWLLYYGLRWPGNAGLRGVPLAKPIVVALAWAWVTVMLPVPPEAWGKVGAILLGRASFIFALALAYDLADMEYDRRQGLTTLAARLGVHQTFRLIFCALLLAALCCFANLYSNIYSKNMALALFNSLVFSAWWLRVLFRRTDWQNWQKVLIDAAMLLQFLVVLGMSWLQ